MIRASLFRVTFSFSLYLKIRAQNTKGKSKPYTLPDINLPEQAIGFKLLLCGYLSFPG